MSKGIMLAIAVVTIVTTGLLIYPLNAVQTQSRSFDVMETTVDGIHNAYKAGNLTARQLTQMYLDRIAAYDQQGPKINSVQRWASVRN